MNEKNALKIENLIEDNNIFIIKLSYNNYIIKINIIIITSLIIHHLKTIVINYLIVLIQIFYLQPKNYHL